MRFDLLHILEHVGMVDGALYRKLSGGQVRRITNVEAGNLTVMISGRKYYGPELAWACQYFCAPLYPVVCIDGDPFNLSKENLGAVRTRRLKCRITQVAGGYKHPLFRLPFPSAAAAKRDWVVRARGFYAADLTYVMYEQERLAPKPDMETLVSLSLERHKPAYKAPKAKSTAPRKVAPAPVPGRTWFWYKEQFLSLPLPVHPSDDIVVRAEAVLRNPLVQFRYDPALDRTVEA